MKTFLFSSVKVEPLDFKTILWLIISSLFLCNDNGAPLNSPKSLLNFNPKYIKTNLGTYYLNYKTEKIDITAGYFYEQFGSGLLLRSWEDRSLGINNAIRGGKIVLRPTDNLSFTGLYVNQRTGFDVSKGTIYGFDSDINLSGILKMDNSEFAMTLLLKNEANPSLPVNR